jgi:hypothetical protein
VLLRKLWESSEAVEPNRCAGFMSRLEGHLHLQLHLREQLELVDLLSTAVEVAGAAGYLWAV